MRKWLALTAVLFTSGFVAEAQSQSAEAQREQLMKTLGAQVRTLTQMSRGQTPYDAAAATAAFTTLRDRARAIPAAFGPPAPGGDDQTEASPKIWQDVAGFAAKATALEEAAAAGIQVAGNGADALPAALQKVGATCSGCHEVFRIKK
jgi:cytochrome c556